MQKHEKTNESKDQLKRSCRASKSFRLHQKLLMTGSNTYYDFAKKLAEFGQKLLWKFACKKWYGNWREIGATIGASFVFKSAQTLEQTLALSNARRVKQADTANLPPSAVASFA